MFRIKPYANAHQDYDVMYGMTVEKTLPASEGTVAQLSKALDLWPVLGACWRYKPEERPRATECHILLCAQVHKMETQKLVRQSDLALRGASTNSVIALSLQRDSLVELGYLRIAPHRLIGANRGKTVARGGQGYVTLADLVPLEPSQPTIRVAVKHLYINELNDIRVVLGKSPPIPVMGSHD